MTTQFIRGERGKIQNMKRLNLISEGAVLFDPEKIENMQGKSLDEYWSYLHDYLEATLGPQGFEIVQRLQQIDAVQEARRSA